MSLDMIPLHFKRRTFEHQLEEINQFVEKRKGNYYGMFHEKPFPLDVIKTLIHTAGTAPSGANQQPWTYVLVEDERLRECIGELARENERVQDILAAPYVVALMKQKHGEDKGQKIKHYYPNESCAISAGFFFSAIEQVGLRYKMMGRIKGLEEILGCPPKEEHFLLFGIGQDRETERIPVQELTRLSSSYYERMKKRRNIRDFSSEPVPAELIEKAISAIPTSSHYHFEWVSDDHRKQEIRNRAEAEEKKFYEERITEEWKDVLKPLGTNWQKEHITDAPHIIVPFKKRGSENDDISSFILTGIEVGVFLSAIHHGGLCSLTHTPSPMTFIRDCLERPKQEMPIVLLPIGYPKEDCVVPNIHKKPINEILVIL
ncbi:nitroreductase family protein [Bacillus coahuilensis]|uniref:nitroreductase family protein n=1 Tax=Bacillus coahuilensis TaxID=408580 RepID=UPI000A6CDE81|nr:nitroreductase family protein [Bacillus coahuilensis]